MRAYEFLPENKGKKPTKRQRYPAQDMFVFSDTNNDRMYVLNRVMMAAAATDGTFTPDIADQSWVAKMNTAHPYTKQEADMMVRAFDAIKVPIVTDFNKNDPKSKELPSTNTTSPLKGFSGYKKK